jgi:hypothetical protein
MGTSLAYPHIQKAAGQPARLERIELNRQDTKSPRRKPRVFNGGFRWFRHGARMGEENSIAFLIRAHPRNPRFNSAFTWRLGDLAVQLDSIRTPRKFAQPAQIPTDCSTDKKNRDGFHLCPSVFICGGIFVLRAPSCPLAERGANLNFPVFGGEANDAVD